MLKSFYRGSVGERWHGFRLLGVDGTTVFLPNKAAISAFYGVQLAGKGKRPATMGRVVCAYDLLNGLAVKTRLCPLEQGEREIAGAWLEELGKEPGRDLLIYDRGFPAFWLMWQHRQHGLNFLFRVKRDFNKKVKAFVQSGQREQIITIVPTEAVRRRMRERGICYCPQTNFPLRLIRVELPGGQDEILLTSLVDTARYPSHCFKYLYAKRWAVEGFFDRLKNTFRVEVFKSQTPEGIEREFYALIFTCNVHALVMKTSDTRLRSKPPDKKTKHIAQANRAFGLGILKKNLLLILLSKNYNQTIKQTIEKCMKQSEPIRKGRKFPRYKYRTRSKGAHWAVTNAVYT